MRIEGAASFAGLRRLKSLLVFRPPRSENAWDFATDGATAAFDFPGPALGLQTAQLFQGPLVQVRAIILQLPSDSARPFVRAAGAARCDRPGLGGARTLPSRCRRPLSARVRWRWWVPA